MKGARVVALVVQHLPSINKVLGSIPVTRKRKGKDLQNPSKRFRGQRHNEKHSTN